MHVLLVLDVWIACTNNLCLYLRYIMILIKELGDSIVTKNLNLLEVNGLYHVFQKHYL